MVAEVHKRVSQVPMAEVEGAAVPAALGICILAVSSCHVVADQQPRPIVAVPELRAKHAVERCIGQLPTSLGMASAL